MTTQDLLKLLEHNNVDLLIKTMNDITFEIYLETLLKQKHISKSELIKKTLLDRTYAYQIMNGTRKASFDKIIQIALGLKLTLDETNRLLTLSSNSVLYPKKKRDACLIYAINHSYNVFETNNLLSDYDFEALN